MFSVLKFRHSNHRIGAHTCTNHTVPYGTALWGGAVPGTSCQATIAPSLRDISQQALSPGTGNCCLGAHIAAERERQAKTDACLVPLCPLASMVPVFWR